MITKSKEYGVGWVYHDMDGVRMPWYTLPCLEWLDGLNLKDKYVFEYGLGWSTDWFEIRKAIVFGVESNPDWRISKRGFTFHNEIDLYTKAILNYEQFDIICIDGIYRDDCTEYALAKLKKGGFLICDNFEQPEVEPDWPKTRELTKDMKVVFYKQPDHPTWVTVVFQK